jgi:peptidoglycan/xylan/chitin deacetylase (PgdA/CDA1 family)
MSVALTFDTEHPDGPNCPPDATERILTILVREGVPASFFLQGRWASAYPDLARRIAGAGHLVGNHSDSHANLTRFSRAGLVEDVRAAEEAILRHTGVDPRPWFRCPYGTHSHHAELAPTLRGLGYHDAHWNITPEDWDSDLSAAELTARILDGVSGREDNAVVLLHSWPTVVPDALPGVIRSLRRAGARFTTVAALPRDASWLRSTCADPPLKQLYRRENHPSTVDGAMAVYIDRLA